MIRITDEIWKIFEPFFCKTSKIGRPQKWGDRIVLQSLLYILSNGIKWKDLPSQFPPKSTVYSRFRKWVEDGTFALLRDAILSSKNHELEELKVFFVDATFVRALYGGEEIGNTKIGKGSKIMAIVDRNSVPIAAIATSAQPHEITLVDKTLQDTPCKDLIKWLVGDKAYDSDDHDEELKKQGIQLIAPHKRNRTKPPTQDEESLKHYGTRWVVERLFSWMKHARRLLTRFDKRISVFQAFLDLFSAITAYRRFTA